MELLILVLIFGGIAYFVGWPALAASLKEKQEHTAVVGSLIGAQNSHRAVWKSDKDVRALLEHVVAKSVERHGRVPRDEFLNALTDIAEKIDPVDQLHCEEPIVTARDQLV